VSLKLRSFVLAVAAFATIGQSLVVVPGAAAASPATGPTIGQSVKNDLSPPLASLQASPVAPDGKGNHSHRPLQPLKKGPAVPTSPDTIQSAPLGANMPATSTNFEGVNNIDGVLPPDTNGDVGPNDYVQWVNLHFEIFDRTGKTLKGPLAGNTLWSGFGGNCQNTNQGDPVVRYDRMADRWIFTQFAFTTLNGSPVPPFSQCFAVSTTGDPTGTYYRYQFVISNTYLNDYPKLGVWPDAYYMSFNDFNGNTFAGGAAVAFNRASMLNGQPASMVSFGPLGAAYGGMLPSDLDGSIPPPAGSPDYFGAIDTSVAPSGSTFQIWKFHVDWTTPANSTFGTVSHTPDFNLAVATYKWFMCNGSRSCISQPGTGVGLDAIPDRLMNRLQYRRFADGHESLVANHTVGIAGNQAGVRWYEVRGLSSAPVVYQQGTYAPSNDSRWMGSIAMDQAGNMALGYSVSSGTVFPTIRYTGRLASDALGTLPQGESSVIAGGGSQLSGLNRWGDYSMMAVDPVDDCTFWYTQEYMAATSSAGWQTRVASFTFPNCPPNAIPDAPANLMATTVSSSQINLSWDASPGATSYKVQRSSDGVTFAQIATTTTANYSDIGLVAGTTYYYEVTASNSIGDSAPSNIASATTYLSVSQAPQGTWVGTYGADGYDLLGWNGNSGDLVSMPAASVVVDQGARWQWNTSTTDVRALQSPDGTTRRATTLYHASQIKIHLSFPAAYSGNLHLYGVDWDNNGRQELVTIDDGSGARSAGFTNFNQGLWLSSPISVAAAGTVSISVTHNSGVNAVLSGIFLGDAPGVSVPPTPTGLSATVASSSQINLSWNSSIGATGYKVERSPDGNVFAQIGTSTTTSFSNSGLSPATTYYYRVRASNLVGDSSPSSVVSATTYFAVNQAPQGTWVGTFGTDGSALLGWNGNSGDLVSMPPAGLVLDQGARWQWNTGTSDVRALQSPDASTRRATCVYHATQIRIHLTFAAAYSGNLHVYGVDWDNKGRQELVTIDDGSGPRSGNFTNFSQGAWLTLPISVSVAGTVAITVTANAGVNAVLSGIFLGDAPSGGPPAAPTGLTATPISSSQINLTWSASSGATSYKVERSTDNVTFTQIATVTTTSYSDTALAPSTTYYYQVVGSNSFGDSGPSSVAPATTYLAVSQAPQGTWVGTYGGSGYALMGWNGSSGDLVSLPLANLVVDQASRWQWNTGTSDVRALQSPDAGSRRATCTYHATQIKLHLSFTSAFTGNLHIYAVDWDNNGRQELMTIDDGTGPRSASLSNFSQGAWVNLPISVAAGGTVSISVVRNAGVNAVLSGIFLGG
jgi:fibronectin type 3 domain-containing protein